MMQAASTLDATRFRWTTRAVLVGSAAVLVLYVVNRGWGANPPHGSTAD